MKYGAYISLLLCNFFWSTNIVLGQFLITALPLIWLTFLRWTFAIVVLILLARFFEKVDYWQVIKNSWLKLASMGLLGVVLFNLLTYISLQYTSPTNVGLISALSPTCIMFFSAFLLKEKLSTIQASGFIISFFGVVFILTSGNPLQLIHTKYNFGDFLMIIVVLCWTFYSIIGRKLLSVAPITTTALSAFFGLILMLPYALVTPIHFSKISFVEIVSILYIGIFASAFSFVLWNKSVHVVGVGKASISMNLVPVITASIVILLGEKITNAQIWGGIIVLLGVLLTMGIFEKRKWIVISEVK
ncbi:DMT family transporter [Ureibacillus sp. NPDC094379]